MADKKIMVCGVDVSVFSAYDTDTIKNAEPAVEAQLAKWSKGSSIGRRRLVAEFKATAVKLALSKAIKAMPADFKTILAKAKVTKTTALAWFAKHNSAGAVAMALGVGNNAARELIATMEQGFPKITQSVRSEGISAGREKPGINKGERSYGSFPASTSTTTKRGEALALGDLL